MSLRLMSAVISTTQHSQSKSDSSEKVLRQLLECVQACQKRYGGKTELATEFDSCVLALCLTLEEVLLHGIRIKPLDSLQSSALKQVSDIVANSLHIGSENPSFWGFVEKYLTRHERERYSILKHIWTDTGKGRAWIRASLNERSLERYFHTLLSNPDLIKRHYEEWALLRDEEKSTMLPNMAAGVGSILFAISIDKPELNSGILQKLEVLKPKSEPIIQAPIPDRAKHKKSRKVARQFISFDEDDTSMLSTSVPSTSSSISSDSNDNQSTKSSSKLSEIVEESKALKRPLSFEYSGSREKFSSEVPETLTPLSHVEIGELTPVSVEINENFESPDDILEVPTDISAVLTAVESRNKEELQKKQDKIVSLTREVDSLKEQLKKYISAIQMLNKGDDPAALEDLTIDQPNYKNEAKIFEKKLVQVAEMHAELMDFNNSLQQALLQKDQLLEKLKGDLEELRGPMPGDELPSESRSVNVWIPSAFLTGSGSASHHVYQIFLRAGSDEWNIYRRYAQFHALHSDLKKLDPTLASFDFPPKKSIRKKDSALVEDRRKRLQLYLRRVLSHWPELAHCNSRFLLEQHLAFFKDQKGNEEKSRGIFSRRSNRTSDNHYTGL